MGRDGMLKGEGCKANDKFSLMDGAQTRRRRLEHHP